MLRVTIGTNTILESTKEEPLGLGGYTGLLPWKPEGGILKIEAQGYPVLEKKSFVRTGETPLLVLQEADEKSLNLLVLPNSKTRVPAFYDAINLTAQANIKIQANKKDFELPKGQRIRLTTEKSLTYTLPNQPSETVDPSENQNFLMVLFSDSTGQIRAVLTYDNPL